jgi:hypothetical protein
MERLIRSRVLPISAPWVASQQRRGSLHISRRQGAPKRPVLLTVGIAVMYLSGRSGGAPQQTNEAVDSNDPDVRRPGDSFC